MFSHPKERQVCSKLEKSKNHFSHVQPNHYLNHRFSLVRLLFEISYEFFHDIPVGYHQQLPIRLVEKKDFFIHHLKLNEAVFTIAMMIFSVAINGNSCLICLSMT